MWLSDELNKQTTETRRNNLPIQRTYKKKKKKICIRGKTNRLCVLLIQDYLQGELKSTKCIFNTLTPRLLGVRAAIWPGCQSKPFYTRQPPFPAPLDDSFGPLTNKRQTTQTGARGHHPRLQELFNAGECFTHSRLLVPGTNDCFPPIPPTPLSAVGLTGSG